MTHPLNLQWGDAQAPTLPVVCDRCGRRSTLKDTDNGEWDFVWDKDSNIVMVICPRHLLPLTKKLHKEPMQ